MKNIFNKINFLKQSKNSRKDHKKFYVKLLFYPVIFLGIFFLAPLLEVIYGPEVESDYLCVAGLTVLVSGLAIVPQSLLQREFAFHKLFAANIS